MIRSYVYNTKEGRLEKDVAFSRLAGILKKGQDRIWLDVEDKLDEEEVELLTETFGLHPIAVEDCIMVNTRPKIETYDGYIFVVVHTAGAKLGPANGDQIELNIFLGKRFLITVHQGRVPSIVASEDKLLRTPQLLKQGTDHFFHAIYDRLVDNYFPLMDKVDDEIDAVEDEIFKAPKEHCLTRMVELRKSLASLRRGISPLRETTHLLTREDFGDLLSTDVRIYFRDVYDHIVRIIDLIDGYRDSVATAFEIYHFMISNRMNEVMKTLTIIATIILPLTLITGIYGMNFEIMPELQHPMGYFAVLGLMATLTIIMLTFFRRKHWI